VDTIVAIFAQATEPGQPATEQAETEVRNGQGRRGRPVAGPDAIDEMIEVHGGRLHVRADRTHWINVADARTALNDHPIRFATSAVVGYLTPTGGAVVAVVGMCSRCGCLLQPDPSAQRLRCPATGAMYHPDGRLVDSGGHYRPPPLPLLQARRAGRHLQALVPHKPGAS
jgi:Rieske Fe-S protein